MAIDGEHSHGHPSQHDKQNAQLRDLQSQYPDSALSFSTSNTCFVGQDLVDLIGGPKNTGIVYDQDKFAQNNLNLLDPNNVEQPDGDSDSDQFTTSTDNIAFTDSDNLHNNLMDYAEIYDKQEEEADQRYSYAIDLLQSEIQERGATPQLIFITQTVVDSEPFQTRLKRLAQDLGIAIAYQTEDPEESLLVSNLITPPSAESVDAYWDNVESVRNISGATEDANQFPHILEEDFKQLAEHLQNIEHFTKDDYKILKTLLLSRDPRSVEIFTELFKRSDFLTEAYSSSLLFLPKFLPDAVKGIKNNYDLNDLASTIEPLLESVMSRETPWHPGFAQALASTLLEIGSPSSRNILERYLLTVLEKEKELITAKDFETAYLPFRKQYGDLPEISQRIRIVST